MFTALRSPKADNGYYSKAFADFLGNIPEIRRRVEAQYAGTDYPFFSVTFTPKSGAKRSVMATDEILNGDVGTGMPVSSSRVKPRLPSAWAQFR